MSPRNEMDALLNDAIEMASLLIQKHGGHIPFAMAINSKLERVNIAVDDTEMAPVDQLANDLLDAVREGCAAQSYRAILLAKNVEYESADHTRSISAIEMTIDHIAADGVTCYLPYTLGTGNLLEPEKLVATEPQLNFFSKRP